MNIFDYNFKDRIISDLADALCKKIAKQVVEELQELKEDNLLSGEDSGLKNVWDEICVQVQKEQSIYWDMYISVIHSIIEKSMKLIAPYEKMAIWWQSDDPEKTLTEDCKDVKGYIFNMEAITEYICKEHILPIAADYTNPAIEAYLDC